jgi:ankyrin repeat protein
VAALQPELSMVIGGGRYHSVLQAAAHSASHQVVELLLAAGVREASPGGFYGTAINAASEKGDDVMLMSLLRNNRNARTAVNHPGGTYGYPLIAAAARGDCTSVEVLLERGAQVNQPNRSGTIALHQAVANGHLNVMELLIQKSSAVNQISTVFGTPLHAACRGQHTEIAKILLERGADPSIKDQRLRIPLHEAAEVKGGLDQVIREILKTRPELVDEVDVDSNTALQLASMAGNTDVVRVLLDYHANCAIGDKFNAQPLFRAAGCGHADIVELLLEEGHADPNARDCFGRTALHGPAQTTDVRVHKLLISKNADVNIVGNDMKTALHEACNMGRIENVKLLLECKNIEINELDNDQFPPLYKALCSSDANKDYFDKCVKPEIVKMLLERDDIDVNASNGIAVQEAARKGLYGFVEKMLTERNANIQMQGGKCGGVLQAAAISGNLKLVNLLLKPEYHADVNLQGGEFGCPLAAAAAFGHVHIVRRLLEAGANPCVTGVGRYGSPSQSVCQKVDTMLKARDGYKWGSIAVQIRSLIQEYGGPEVSSKVEQRYEDWRWLLSTTGWGWAPPGEM